VTTPWKVLGSSEIRGHAADHHTGAAHRRTRFQATDVVEARLHGVGVAAAEAAQVGRLQRQEDQRQHAQQHEDADQDLDLFLAHDLKDSCP
jgi:hypothetical protein